MLTQTEFQRLVDQINEAFEEDKKRISNLEKEVAELKKVLSKPKTTK